MLTLSETIAEHNCFRFYIVENQWLLSFLDHLKILIFNLYRIYNSQIKDLN